MATTTSEKVIKIRVDQSGVTAGTTGINNQLRTVITTAGGATTAITGTGAALNRTGAAAGGAARQLQAANNNTSLLNTAFGTLNGTTGAAAQALGRFNSTLGSMALAGASAGVLALGGALSFATVQASGYADKLAQITTLVDTTTFSMGQLSAGLKEQAAVFGQDPIAQAGAAYDIISSGASTAADAIGTLNSANVLAAVGATNVGVAADGLTSVVNAFAGQALKASDAADSMFVTVRDGKISMEQLSSSIGNVAPVAATLGLSLDDVGASIAALTLGGVGGAEAVTNIRAALTSIIKPSSEASKLAKQIGLDYSSSALQAKGWANFLDDVKTKTKGSQDQMAILAGGTEALSAMLALTTTGADSFNKSLENMRNKAGAAADGLKKIQEASPSFQFERVMAAMKVQAIGVGEVIATALVPALKMLADNFDTIVSVIEVAMIPLATRLVLLYGTALVQAVVTFAATAALRFASLAAAQGVLAASTATLSAGFSGLAGLFGGPLGVAFAGVTYGLYTLATNSSQARAMVDELAASASSASSNTAATGENSLLAARGVTTFGGQAGAAAQKLWEMASAARSAAVETAKLNLTKAKTTYDTVYGQTSAGLSDRSIAARNAMTASGASFGDRARAAGSMVQIGWDQIWKPGAAKADRAAAAARQQLQAAQRTYNETVLKPSEAFIPKPVTAGGGGGALPKPAGSGGSGASDAANRVKQENDFWATLKGQLDTAKLFGIELQKQTEEQRLQKILGSEISATDAARISAAVTEIAQAKSVTDLKRATFEAQNRYTVEQQRGVNLTESQKAVEDELLRFRLAALNDGANINTADYKTNEDKLRVILSQNQALNDQVAHLKDAQEFAKKYSAGFSMDAELQDMAKSLTNFEDAFAAGKLKDAMGQPMSQTVHDAVVAGYDAARVDVLNRPLEILAKVSPTADAELQRSKANSTRDVAMANLAASNFTPEKAAQVAREITENWKLDMGRANAIVANAFADKVVSKLDGFADIAEIFSKKMSGVVRGLGDVVDRMRQNANPNGSASNFMSLFGSEAKSGFDGATSKMMDASQGLKDLKNPLKNLTDSFGKNGSFMKGIGSAVGGALQGAQIGQGVGDVMGMLGIKNASKGAKIGGTIGGLTGNPIIAAGASIIGGLLGSIFTKAKKGAATITGVDAGGISLSGNSAKAQTAASGLAGGVQSGLSSIASELGATIGAFRVTIGMYKDQIRVQTNSTPIGGKGSVGAITFKTEQEAVTYAIKAAISQGALQGLSDFGRKAVAALDIDSAISVVKDYNAVMADLANIQDPMTGAVNSVIKSLDALRSSMMQVGASTEDLNKVDQYRDLKLKEVLKSQMSTVNDMLKILNGEGSGVTQLARLNRDMAEFKTYQDRIAKGETGIDQAAFSALGQEIFGLAKDVYGTATSQFQDIRASLISTTTQLGGNLTTAFNTAAGINTNQTGIDATTASIQASSDAQVAATNAQTDAVVAQLAILTDYTRQLVAAQDGGSQYSPVLAAKLASMNGMAA